MPVKLPVSVNARDWQEGAATAPVTLVEYGDFQCEDCIVAYAALKSLRAEMGENIRFVFRQLPLTDIHVYALDAAKAAEAAGAQNRFWEMHDALFEQNGKLDAGGLSAAARKAGLDEAAWNAARRDERAYAGIREDVDGIRTTGIGKTPTLFLNGFHYEGLLTLEALRQALASAATA